MVFVIALIKLLPGNDDFRKCFNTKNFSQTSNHNFQLGYAQLTCTKIFNNFKLLFGTNVWKNGCKPAITVFWHYQTQYPTFNDLIQHFTALHVDFHSTQNNHSSSLWSTFWANNFMNKQPYLQNNLQSFKKWLQLLLNFLFNEDICLNRTLKNLIWKWFKK